MRRPNFVFLGQGKSGTSFIWRVLRENPDIAFPRKKELHFFNKGMAQGLAWYDGHFADLPQDRPYIGEVSPSYLDPDAVARIADVLGRDIKVGFVLRRPIEQAYSRYMQNLCAAPKGYGFERYARLMAARLSKTVDAIELCRDLFGAHNVLALMFERDVVGDTPTFETRILDHLARSPTNNAAPFLARPRVNPGVRPHYIFSEDGPVQVHAQAETYEIPPHTLVFCAQPRNSRVEENPEAAKVRMALDAQAQWDSSVSAQDYKALQDEAVLPAAARLENELGYDMAHWRNAPRALRYAPAPPPPRFRVS